MDITGGEPMIEDDTTKEVDVIKTIDDDSITNEQTDSIPSLNGETKNIESVTNTEGRQTENGSEIDGTEHTEFLKNDGEVNDGKQDGGELKDDSKDDGELKDDSKDEGELKDDSKDDGELKDDSKDEGELNNDSKDDGEVINESKYDGEVNDDSKDDGELEDDSKYDGELNNDSKDDGELKDGSKYDGGLKDGPKDEGELKDGSKDDGGLKDGSKDEGEMNNESKDDGELMDDSKDDEELNVDSKDDVELKDGSKDDGELMYDSKDDGAVKEVSKNYGKVNEKSAVDGEINEDTRNQDKEVKGNDPDTERVSPERMEYISDTKNDGECDVEMKDDTSGNDQQKVQGNYKKVDDEIMDITQEDDGEIKNSTEDSKDNADSSISSQNDRECVDSSQDDVKLQDLTLDNGEINASSADDDGEVKDNSFDDAKLKGTPRRNGMITGEASKGQTKSVELLRNMLEDIEEGELDYEEEGEVVEEEEELPDLPEYDPSAHKKANGYGSEEGEILSDNEDEEREEGEIKDDDETGQVYICVDPLNDKWKKVSREEQKKIQDLEDGQIDEAEEPVIRPSPPAINTAPRFIPRTLCKYFNNGLCRWGSTCRFLHPGINDKGIPTDLQPTWNATAGNYVMHRPPGMYPNAYGKAPPPMECINVPVMPTPIVDMTLITAAHTELVAVPVGLVGEIHVGIPLIKESAWEKGLRRAKEIKEAASRRREEDQDFEHKRLSLRIPEHVMDKESDFEPGVDPELSAEKALNEWGIRSRESRGEPFERRHRGDDRRSDRYADRFSRPMKGGSIDRSSGRARLAVLPPQHPIRREERQRQRERERRERDEKDKEVTEKDRLKIESIYKSDRLVPEPEKPVSDPRVTRQQPTENTNTIPPVKVPKTVGATEWHDPWMRAQQPPSTQVKSETQKQPGVEAISDSDSSSSDSDSDSESSSSDKSSGSDSDSSSSSDGDSKKVTGTNDVPPPTKTTEPADPLRKERRAARPTDEKQPAKVKVEKTEPLSYEEWKRLQTIQKAQYHQQMANQYKTALESKDVPVKKEASPIRAKEATRIPKPEKPEDPLKVPVIDSIKKEEATSVQGESQNVPENNVEYTDKTVNMRNDDKFDSPKRTTEKNSDTGSDSDSDSSDSDSSNSDSDDSESDSESDSEVNANVVAAGLKPVKPPPVDPAAVRKDIRINLAEKPKPEVDVPSLAGKRPARKDELLKELKAVEDAIARKRAKID